MTLSTFAGAAADERFAAVTTLLCDADGTLFDSEPPAFEASAGVTNDFLHSLGVTSSYTPERLRLATTGKNFRATAVDLCNLHGVDVSDVEPSAQHRVLTPTLLEQWVRTERRTVTAYLATALRRDARVDARLRELAARYRLAAVSSSHTDRLHACFTATGMADLFPAEAVFSADNSLPVPCSKPNPAVYLLAGEQMGCAGPSGLAVEDSATGAASAVAAGFPTIGILHYVPLLERPARRTELREAGALDVVDSWTDLARLLVTATSKEQHHARQN